MTNFDFFKMAIKDYRVGAITESSKFVIRKVISYLKPEHKYIVEYGAGNGVVTREILKSLPAGGRLAAVELNADFAAQLEKIKDPRLIVVRGDVLVVSAELSKLGFPQIDAVICNMPFTVIKAETREEIVRNTQVAIREGGMFLVYQYSVLVLPLLKKHFSKVELSFEPRNLPPYFFMKAEKTK